MKLISKIVMGLIVSAGLSAAAPVAQFNGYFNNSNSYNEGVPLSNTDQSIKQNIELALQRNSSLDSSNIHITVVDGSVTMEGRVSSSAEKSIAESVVNGVSGVTFVQNNLVVSVPAP